MFLFLLSFRVYMYYYSILPDPGRIKRPGEDRKHVKKINVEKDPEQFFRFENVLWSPLDVYVQTPFSIRTLCVEPQGTLIK